jgi:hypothetical protein
MSDAGFSKLGAGSLYPRPETSIQHHVQPLRSTRLFRVQCGSCFFRNPHGTTSSDERMSEKPPESDDRIYSHLLTLLSVSAAMVGVCLTAISLVTVIEAFNKVEQIVDDALAIATIVFSIVTLLSFLGIRTRIRLIWPRYMFVMDVMFCIGIGLMVIASMMLTFIVI